MSCFQSFIVIVAFTISVDWVTLVWALGVFTWHFVSGTSCIWRTLLAGTSFCDEFTVCAIWLDAGLSVWRDNGEFATPLTAAILGYLFVLTALRSYTALPVFRRNGIRITHFALTTGLDLFSCTAHWSHALLFASVWKCVWLTFFTSSNESNDFTMSAFRYETLKSVLTNFLVWVASFASTVHVDNFVEHTVRHYASCSIFVNHCERIAKLAGSICHDLLSVTTFRSWTFLSTSEYYGKWLAAFTSCIVQKLLTRTTSGLLAGCTVTCSLVFADDTLVWLAGLASSYGGLLLSFTASWEFTFQSTPVWFLEVRACVTSCIRQYLLSCSTYWYITSLSIINGLLIS